MVPFSRQSTNLQECAKTMAFDDMIVKVQMVIESRASEISFWFVESTHIYVVHKKTF